MTETKKLYEALKNDWREVSIDEVKESGHAHVGSIGVVRFRESANDPAVIITIPELRFKGRAEDMLAVIERIRSAFDLSD